MKTWKETFESGLWFPWVTEIYLDLDDTLNSLTLTILYHHGRLLKMLTGKPNPCATIGPFDYDAFPVECGYDMVAAFNKLCACEITIPNFWELVPPELFGYAPRSLECEAIVKWSIEKVGVENVFIATSPTKCERSHGYKYQWIVDNLPAEMHRQYFITPRKARLGASHRLLIDDCPGNLTAWNGPAIKIERPWNVQNSGPA